MMDIRTTNNIGIGAILSLTPLSESIMILYPSCMALKVAFTHFLMHVQTIYSFSISYKVVCDLNQDGRYFLLYPDLLLKLLDSEFLTFTMFWDNIKDIVIPTNR
jgi:hypothetical protein